MWVRGLKLRALLLVMTLRAVAPYVGAWIETEHIGGVYAMATSHPMWVRGLKPTFGKMELKNKGRTLCGCVD